MNNVLKAADILKKLDFHGPLALSWDDTDLEQSLSVWSEGNDNFDLLGGSNGPIRVTSVDAVESLFDDLKLKKADKVHRRSGYSQVHFANMISIFIAANLSADYSPGKDSTHSACCGHPRRQSFCGNLEGHTLQTIGCAASSRHLSCFSFLRWNRD